MIVADASALVDLLLGRNKADRTRAAIASELHLHAPHLVDTEVLHALRRWAARGWLSLERAGEALTDLADLGIVHHAHAPLGDRVWGLRDRVTAYDATYVALAEALGATLVTADGRLAATARKLVAVFDVS